MCTTTGLGVLLRYSDFDISHGKFIQPGLKIGVGLLSGCLEQGCLFSGDLAVRDHLVDFLTDLGSTACNIGDFQFWKEITPGEYNRLLILLIEKAVVWNNKLEIEFKTAGIKSLMEGFKND